MQQQQAQIDELKEKLFQSSPDPEAGCNLGVIVGFVQDDFVSILTRPGGRVQHPRRRCKRLSAGVSILTRPGGRVQRGHRPLAAIP